MSYRIIQWGTGNVGKHALRAVVERPDLDLVGVRVYNPDKVGTDAGRLIGGDPIGVTATDDVDAILGLDADIVCYNALGTTLPSFDQPLDDICRLLASGKNVVSTAVDYYLYLGPDIAPRHAGAAVIDRIATACTAGNTTFYETGLDPGFTLDYWPITLSRLCRRIDRIRITELVNLENYASSTMTFMGFGLPPDAPAPMYALFEDTANSPYAPSLRMIADAIGTKIDDVQYTREVIVADEPITTAYGVIEAGTGAAHKHRFTARRDGRAIIEFDLIWRVHEAVAPQWPSGHFVWHLDIEGDPRLHSEVTYAAALDARRPTSTTAAMHCVNAIPVVCSSPPGIANHLTLAPFAGRFA